MENTNIGNGITEERKKKLIKRLKNTIYKGGIAHYEIFRIGQNNEEFEFMYEWLKENDIQIRGKDGTTNYENQDYVSSFVRESIPEVIDEKERERLFLKMKSFTKEEKDNYAEEYLKVRDELIKHNMKLAKWFVGTKEMRQFDKPLDDKLQMAYMGLIEAVSNYDVDAGTKFSTYATKTMYRTILREIIREKEGTKNNYELNQQLLKLDEVEEQIFNKYARESNVYEISELLGVSLKRAKELKVLQALQKKSSLEELEEKMDEDTLHDSYKTESDSSGGMIVEGIYYEAETSTEELTSKDIVAEEVMRLLLKDDIKKALEILSERERTVLISHFGLENNKPKTFEEIGKELNLSRSRIQAIMYDGLRKIRNLHSKLKKYMDVAGKQQDDDFIL